MKSRSTWAWIVAAVAWSCSPAEDPAEDPAEGAVERVDGPRLVADADTGLMLTEGFDADLVYDVPKEQGSWVAMDFDSRGRLLVSDQDDKGLFRLTLPAVGDAGAAVSVEPLHGSRSRGVSGPSLARSVCCTRSTVSTCRR